MPITVLPAPPHGLVGPGQIIQWVSDFSGTLPSNAVAGLSIFGGPTFETNYYSEALPVSFPAGAFQMMTRPLGQWNDSIAKPIDGEAVHAVVTLKSGSTTLDSGSQSATWNATTGLPIVVTIQALQTEGRGLTTSQSTLLTQTHDNTVTDLSLWDTFTSVTLPSLNDVLSGITTNTQTVVTTAAGALTIPLGTLFEPAALDAFTLVEITGGETCEPVFAGDLEFHFGIVVRSTTIPDHYGLGGYDGRHYEPSLALLNVFRGTEMVARIPIHVADFMLTPVPGQNNSTEAQIVYLAVAPNLSLEVWWGQGVCGRVYLLRLP